MALTSEVIRSLNASTCKHIAHQLKTTKIKTDIIYLFNEQCAQV